MRIVIQPLAAPDRKVDVTAPLVHAIARCLGDHLGGNEVLNELEAEVHLRQMLRDASSAATEGGAQ